jgi:hypothetical protein
MGGDFCGELEKIEFWEVVFLNIDQLFVLVASPLLRP